MTKFIGLIAGFGVAVFLLGMVFNPTPTQRVSSTPQPTQMPSQSVPATPNQSVEVSHTTSTADDRLLEAPPIPVDIPTTEEPPVSNIELQTIEQQWQPFWSPFHSERSASGFATRIERLTGRQMRVQQEESGRYQVVFSHWGETDRSIALTQIAAASGLEIEQASHDPDK
ncbi:MAG: transglycosylase [endosymbiont of Escarpia spicata]|uniref:Transglycosylase n=1 Tax=endosymbiont of Escarpia spicata TaxID=2200908 RepID=A0A370DLL5_9GAMM|nr:MAG: transglycosylase [endosymbiont of Escarpia spicata]